MVSECPMGVWYGICGRTGNLKDFLITEGSTLWRMWSQQETYIVWLFVLFMVIVKRTGQRDVFLYDHRKKNGIGDGCFNNEKRE